MTTWPDDLDGRSPLPEISAQAEDDSFIVGRQVAGSAGDPADQLSSRMKQRQFRSDGVAIAFFPNQLNADPPVARSHIIAKQYRPLSDAGENGVGRAIVIEITNR